MYTMAELMTSVPRRRYDELIRQESALKKLLYVIEQSVEFEFMDDLKIVDGSRIFDTWKALYPMDYERRFIEETRREEELIKELDDDLQNT